MTDLTCGQSGRKNICRGIFVTTAAAARRDVVVFSYYCQLWLLRMRHNGANTTPLISMQHWGKFIHSKAPLCTLLNTQIHCSTDYDQDLPSKKKSRYFHTNERWKCGKSLDWTGLKSHSSVFLLHFPCFTFTVTLVTFFCLALKVPK